MMPYLAPSAAILRTYSIGSRNSSSVGLNVGASGIPKSLFCCERSSAWFGPPLLSTVDKSMASARRALSGIAWLLPDGGPFRVPGIDGVVGFGLTGVIDGPGIVSAAEAMAGRAAEMAPPITSGNAIWKVDGHCGPDIDNSIGALEAAEQRVSVMEVGGRMA